jgi:Xaa-Pro dipeptidase
VRGSLSCREIQAGDPVIVDLAPRVNGYWGDSCNTFISGKPTDEHERVFAEIASALAEAIATVRPGMPVHQLDEDLRKRLAALGGVFPHHSGHGIGVTYHEEPRVVPYNEMAFEENMVIALEPGVYFPGKWGMRLEYVLKVTKSRAELLTKFPHTL